jgi:phospholipase/carboxylesterase
MVRARLGFGRFLPGAVLTGLAMGLCGCPVTQSQNVPVAAMHVVQDDTGIKYWLYVPSYYSSQKDWPLVVTLHGTVPFDPALFQINEWKALAEEKGFLVAAPELKSSQGILPVIKKLWFNDLRADEQTIMGTIDAICGRYHVDRKAVLLTGFSSGGFPLYYTGLRNPQRFNMLIARSCNSDMDIFESIPITDQTRQLPMMISAGKDEHFIPTQSWQAFRYLRERKCTLVKHEEIRGGHIRRPDLAYKHWLKYLPERHRR